MEIHKIQQNNTQSLIQDLRQIIEQARGQVAATANYVLTTMYWHIGERINREVLGNQRAEYGKQIVSQVSTQLQEEYGKKGFEPRNIRRMMQFAKEFPDSKIVSQLATKLFWSHFIEVLPLKDSLQKEFYITLAASERWGRDRLRKETTKREVKRPRFKFSMCGIKIGEQVTFDPTGLVVKVASDDSIEYEGRIYKLSPFVGTFMPEEQRNASGAYQGAKYFSYKGKVLDEIRKERENN